MTSQIDLNEIMEFIEDNADPKIPKDNLKTLSQIKQALNDIFKNRQIDVAVLNIDEEDDDVLLTANEYMGDISRKLELEKNNEEQVKMADEVLNKLPPDTVNYIKGFIDGKNLSSRVGGRGKKSRKSRKNKKRKSRKSRR